MKNLLPYVLGAIMGAMLLVVFHDDIAAGAFEAATLTFALAHVAILAAVLLIARLFGLRNLHKPSAAHAVRMFASAAFAIATIHHIHGGPVA